jgi:alpha-L-fucosidase
MALNGEAIYSTRHWKVFGEGPTKTAAGSLYRGPGAQFASDDIRFTTKGNSLYAIMLAWPQERKLIIKSLASNSPYYRSEVARIEPLGSQSKAVWSRNKEGLAVKLPQKAPCDYAYVFRINPLPE